MKSLLLVALGGAVGSVARYGLSTLVMGYAGGARFPAGTFVVNVLGCFVAGVLAHVATRHEWFTQDLRLLLFTGLLGGFTTFSAFGLETVYLMKRGDFGIAAANVVLSVAAGLAALWLGLGLAARAS